jgi:monoamine oxidase
LVEWLGSRLADAGVAVHRGCAVRTIEWARDRARIDYDHARAIESVEAHRVIVALPLGVLRDDGVRFIPEVAGHRAAMRHLGVAQVAKIVACLREPVWGDGTSEIAFVHGRGRWFPTFWLRSRREQHQLTAWAGGGHALALAGLDADQLLERAVDDFASVTGVARARIAGAVLHTHFHDYRADPWARGAYSYTRVGEVHAPHELARPLVDTVFFAGESTSANYEGTVTGALGSGYRAANRVTRSLR